MLINLVLNYQLLLSLLIYKQAVDSYVQKRNNYKHLNIRLLVVSPPPKIKVRKHCIRLSYVVFLYHDHSIEKVTYSITSALRESTFKKLMKGKNPFHMPM